MVTVSIYIKQVAMASSKSNVRNTLKPLLIECQILAICAPFCKTKYYKCYAILFQLGLMAGFLVSVYGKQSSLFDSYTPVVKAVDQIANLFLTFASATTTLLTIFFYPSKLDKLIKDCSYLDKTVGKCFKHKKLFWISFVLVQLLSVLIICVDSWVWISGVGYVMNKYYIIRNIQYYQVNMTVLLMFWIIMEIYCRCKAINELLITATKEFCNDPFIINLNKRRETTYKDLKRIAQLQNFLFSTLNEFNEIFGIIILFIVLFFIAYMIQYTTELIAYGIINNQMNGASFGVSLLAVSAAWIIICLILLLTLAAAGHYISMEANKAPSICYSAINNMNASSDHDVLKEELKLIAQQTLCRNPSLSASGFFVVNFTMMGFVVSSLTSYIIVAIQFLI